MRKQRNRQAENKRYYQSIKARGLANTCFLCPTAIREDVRQFIKTRTQELVIQK